MDENIPLDEKSVVVQTHIEILQNVIQRMSTNSASCKAYSITIVSAILVIVADKNKPEYSLISILPTILFLALDAYYLALEKGFRAAYEDFVKKVHLGCVSMNDVYDLKISGKMFLHQINAIKSFSVWGFYSILFVSIFMTNEIIKGV